ncbi:metallophosphoesterase family protein [Thermococcus barophilus]|nr:metallophosphoesterase [Thermococcus barophilus]
MRFVHISDVHVVSTENECKEIYGVSTNPALKLLKSANSIKKLNPNFVVVTGDIAAMADKDYADRVLCWYLTFKEFFIRPLERSGIKVFVVPGNHDVNKAFGLDIYRMLFGEENYQVDIDGIRLIFTTPKMRARKCKPSDQLINWLKSTVKEGSLIFSHYPLSQWKRNEEVLEIFDGKVRGFFSGHLHKNSFTLGFGFPEVQTSALSGNWWNTWGDDGCIRIVRITNNDISSKLVKVV